MSVVAEIFSQGEEVVTGQVVDSNAAWLATQLTELGFSVTRHTAVGDRLDDLVALVKEIAGRADCCICTGGLGPTVDDLTAEAVGIASGLPLVFDPEALRQIETYFANRQRTMPAANRKQAYFPQGALRIDNPVGTAPGFMLQLGRCWFAFLPGVPMEMKTLFADVVYQLRQRFALRPDRLVVLRSVGIGESAIQQALSEVNLPVGVQLGFRAAPDEVQTKLLFSAEVSTDDLRGLVERVKAAIGDYVFAVDGLDSEAGGDLLGVIDGLLPAGSRLALLETASGGWLAAKCQPYHWLNAAFVYRDVAQANRQFGIDSADDAIEPAAHRLAQALKTQGAELALVQLYLGSLDDYRDRDRTIVLYNGLLTPVGWYCKQHTLGGPASSKQTQSAWLTLDLLRRYLQKLCP